MGVKGAHPLGRLPLWGREGVTLVLFQSVSKKRQIDKSRAD